MLRSILASSRYFIAVAVFGTFVSSVALIVYGMLTVYDVVVDAFTSEISCGWRQISGNRIHRADRPLPAGNGALHRRARPLRALYR